MITKALLLDKGVVQLDNEYLDAYISLINNNLNTPKQKYKTQSHHIIPEYYFEHLNIPVDNSKENRVNLLYRDHLLAHYYLFKCSDNEYKYSNSVVIVIGRKNSPVPIKDFDYVLDDYIMSIIQEAYEYAIMVQSDPNSEIYKKRVAALQTDEFRLAQSERIKLAYEEGRLIPSNNNATNGKKHYTNGSINVYRFECPEGFTEGFTLSDESRYNMGWSRGLTGERFNTTGGRIRINNGKNHKYVNEDELQFYLDTGEWFEGSLKFDTGQWYTNGKVNTKIVEGKEVPEGFYPGYTGTVNNMVCTCIINNEKLEFNSKKDLFNYLFDNCTNKKGRNKAGWKTVSGLSGYVYKCIRKGKPIELEINGVLSKIEII